MSLMKIALLQIAPAGTLEANLEKGIRCCRKAKEMGADIALFPEMWSNGYDLHSRPAKEWKPGCNCPVTEILSGLFGNVDMETA